jgi:hypothetical protein
MRAHIYDEALYDEIALLLSTGKMKRGSRGHLVAYRVVCLGISSLNERDHAIYLGAVQPLLSGAYNYRTRPNTQGSAAAMHPLWTQPEI